MLAKLPTPAQLMPELDLAAIEQIAAPDRSHRYIDDDVTDVSRRWPAKKEDGSLMNETTTTQADQDEIEPEM